MGADIKGVDGGARADRSWATPILVLAQIGSLQCGSAVAKGLFAAVGPTRTVCLRLWFAAVLLCALVRPRPWRFTRRQALASAGLGCVVAAMNLAYFHAIARLPLGVAATLELLGPLGLAVALARTGRELLYAALAIVGTVLLAAPGNPSVTAAGLGLGLVSALLRAGYVLLNRRIGRLIDGWSGLATALAVGAVLVIPVGILPLGDPPRGGAPAVGETGLGGLTDLTVLTRGLAVALLCAVLPYGLDLVALRRISPRVFGVLLSMSPAIGALVGYAALGERLTTRQLLALACVTAASAGVVRQATRRPSETAPTIHNALSMARSSPLSTPPRNSPETAAAYGAGHERNASPR
jgi:inner membrane transporter RhtA